MKRSQVLLSAVRVVDERRQALRMMDGPVAAANLALYESVLASLRKMLTEVVEDEMYGPALARDRENDRRAQERKDRLVVVPDAREDEVA